MKFFSIFACMILLCSCTMKQNTDNESLKFKAFSFDFIAEVNDSLAMDTEGGRYCRVTSNGVLPQNLAGNDLSILCDSLMSMAEIKILEGKITPVFNEMKPTDLNIDSISACGSQVNELMVDLVTPWLIVWKNYNYTYLCGAAHGMYSTTFVNYSILENKILALSDIFKPGYEAELTGLIRDKLKSDGADLIVPIDEVQIPSDFRLTTHSIEFLYPLYEIAPYSAGEITVELDRYELGDLFREGAESLLYGNAFE